jgi:uncharacterized membrane protein YcaP (DUF421 family)
MDPARIVIRVLFAYVWVRLMVRVTGRRTIGHRDTLSFVLALIIGDMFDDLFWAEVSAAQFVTGVSVLALAHLWAAVLEPRAGRRTWRRHMLKQTP